MITGSSRLLSRMKCTNKKRTFRGATFDVIGVTVLIAYFLHFALPALSGGFREDEMMNLGICWCAGALKSLLANIIFWKLFLCPGDALYYLPLYLYRPGGAVYYLPLYHFFGLDPLPYRIAQIGILAASIPLVYYFSRRGPRRAAGPNRRGDGAPPGPVHRPRSRVARCVPGLRAAGLLQIGDLDRATRLLALYCFSRCPCPLLPPTPSWSRVCWSVHLRRVMWVPLFRGFSLLPTYP